MSAVARPRGGTGEQVDPRVDMVRGTGLLLLAVSLVCLQLAPRRAVDLSVLEQARQLALTEAPVTTGGWPLGPLPSLLQAPLHMLLVSTGAVSEGPVGTPDRATVVVALLGPLLAAILASRVVSAVLTLGVARRAGLLATLLISVTLLPASGWPTVPLLAAAVTAWTLARALRARAALERGRHLPKSRALQLGLGAAGPVLVAPGLLPVTLALLALVEGALGARSLRGAASRSGRGFGLALLPVAIVLGAQAAWPGAWGGALPGVSLASLGVPFASGAWVRPPWSLFGLPLLGFVVAGLVRLLSSGERILPLLSAGLLLLAFGQATPEGTVTLGACALVFLAPALSAALEPALRGPRTMALVAIAGSWTMIAGGGAVLLDDLRLTEVRETISAEATRAERAEPLLLGPLLRWRVLRREWAVPGEPLPLSELVDRSWEGEVPRATQPIHGHLAIGLIGRLANLLVPLAGILVVLGIALRDLRAGLDRTRPGP